MNCLENKYRKWYFEIINGARINPPTDTYTEVHHIVPRCLKGSDESDNLVRLTARQHFICHLLLTKMFKYKSREYYKMIHAFCMVSWCSLPTAQRYTSRSYNTEKKAYAEYMRSKMLGSRWIVNDYLKKCVMIPKDQDIPEGWNLGRFYNWDKYVKRKENLSKLNAKKISNSKKVCINCKKAIGRFDHRCSDFCSVSCKNSYYFHVKSPLTEIYKGDKVKTVKSQNVPAYRKYGWQIKKN